MRDKEKSVSKTTLYMRKYISTAFSSLHINFTAISWYNAWCKIEDFISTTANWELRRVNLFLQVEGNSAAEIRRHLCRVYDGNMNNKLMYTQLS